jgi:hypothetical protein
MADIFSIVMMELKLDKGTPTRMHIYLFLCHVNTAHIFMTRQRNNTCQHVDQSLGFDLKKIKTT